MRLRNPGGVGAAIEQLGRLKSELENCRSGRDAQDVRDQWLRWWDSADAHLRSLFTDSDMVVALFQSQLEIRRIDLTARPYGLLNREVDVWAARLGEEIGRLEALRAFAAVPGQIVVLDTSALVEGVYFTEFGWRGLDGVPADADPVRLIVPILVVEELDDLKRDRRAGARARSVLRRLWELHGERPTEPATVPGRTATVEVFLDDPWQVRRPVNDDEIIARALAVEAATGDGVVLAACDRAMLYRAAAAGLKAALMPMGPVDPDGAAPTA